MLALVASERDLRAAARAPVDPNFASIGDVLGPPADGHPLGFDGAGRDVLSRLLYAGRFSLAGALLALVIALVIGVIAGLIAGYYHGWFDTVSSWVAGLLMALPGIVLLLAARAVLGPSMWMAMAIFGVLMSPAFFRLVYAAVTAVRSELYVDAARVAGLSDLRIIGRHILTVVRAPVIIQSAMVLGIAIAIQAGLDFLGLGDMSIPTWGTMLNDGFAEHLHRRAAGALAEPGDRAGLRRVDDAGQHHARPARAQRRAAAAARQAGGDPARGPGEGRDHHPPGRRAVPAA